MARALQLARLAIPLSSPNPPVGAVLVKEGTVLGEGHTQPPGREHAEIVALREVGPGAAGSALYVTLEPCSHWGRTPPCADAVIAAGVTVVHVGVLDPNPLVSGRGVRLLREAGVEVVIGDGATEAAGLILPHTVYITRHRPLVTLLSEAQAEVRPGLIAEADAVLQSRDGGLELRRRDGSEVPLDAGKDVGRVLRDLADRGISSLLVDDAVLAQRLLEAELADRIVATPGWPALRGFVRVDLPSGGSVYVREDLTRPLLQEPQP